MKKYDLIVIGGGPGGYISAIRAAQLGAKVCLIEKDKVGGTCLNRGCIPTKAIIACTILYEKMLKAANFGIKAENISIDLAAIVERKNKLTAKIIKGVEFLLQKNKVEIIYGTGKLLEPGKVQIDGSETLNADKIILAMGSSPASIPGITLDKKQFLCSDELLDNTEVPEKLDIVGGGVIGIHFAQIYSTLGTQVTIYEALPEILPGIDEEIIALVKRLLKRKKIDIKTNSRFEPKQSCGKTLVCVGRKPNKDGLELTVNEKMETNLPGVYAIGDLISEKQFAHVAYEQGIIAAENALGGNKTFDYNCVPYGIYTNPEIGCVGLTEKAAKEKFKNLPAGRQGVKVGKFPFAALGIAQAMGEIEGFIKFVADENDNLLGVHIIGPEATTLIGSATIALKNKVKVSQLAETIQSHPSYPEGLHEAALATLKKALHVIN